MIATSSVYSYVALRTLLITTQLLTELEKDVKDKYCGNGSQVHNHPKQFSSQKRKQQDVWEAVTRRDEEVHGSIMEAITPQ